MTTVTQEQRQEMSSDFQSFESVSIGNGRPWLMPIRNAASANFSTLGFPTLRDEEWRYTNLSPLARERFIPGKREKIVFERIAPHVLSAGERECHRLVFVNGYYVPGLSSGQPLQAGVRLWPLSQALDTNTERVRLHLARYANYQEQAFTALNTACMNDGAYLYVEPNTEVQTPIELVFVSLSGRQPTATHPRNLLIVDRHSRLSVIERYLAIENDQLYWTNAVTELVAAEDTRVDHYRIQQESPRAYHIATLQIHQQADSDVRSHSLSFGGGLVRYDVNAVLAGQGGNCQLNGLFIADGTQHMDNHLRVDHAMPHCTSREFYKGILSDRARGVFAGRIIVRPDAQKTDAKQTNKNLLLSEDAQVDSKPQLEIFADDVKCTHGATVGQMDEDALFYLRSRGIGEDEARQLLVAAFARENIQDIALEAVREQIEELLWARLPHEHHENVGSEAK